MKRILYFDCFSGISGDMFLGSLVDLGVPEEVLKEGINSLNLDGLEMEFGKTNKNGIEARTFKATVFNEDADTYGFTKETAPIIKEEHRHHIHMNGTLHDHGRVHITINKNEKHHDHNHNEGHGHDHKHNEGHGHEHSHGHSHEHNHDHDHGHEHDHDHNHNHEHNHSHGHSHEGGRVHTHAEGHTHDHGHSHGGHEAHDHHGRTFADIKQMIQNSSLTERSKDWSIEIFRVIAEAEGKIHGAPPEAVHFHEVGAFDSIADIVGAAVGLDYLSPDEIHFSKLPMTQGFVKCNHGIMPLPAPATLEILKEVPTIWEEYRFEMVTPTGAAIAKVLGESFGAPPKGQVLKVGYGAGKKTYERPNVLRGMLMELSPESEKKKTEGTPLESIVREWGNSDLMGMTSASGDGSQMTPIEIYEVEANLDDMTGEELGFLFQRSLDRGALDVWAQSIYMKKNRPAYKVSFLISPMDLEKFTEFLLTETSSFGVRYSEKKRRILDRRFEVAHLPEGDVRIKIGSLGEKEVRRTAEFEDCRKIAEGTGKTLREIMEKALEYSKK